MNRIDRISAILIQLQSRRVVKASDITQRFTISLRTVYRDIRTLEEAGIPIIGEAGVGYSIMEGYRLPPVMFTKEEATAFLTAEKMVEKLTDASSSAHFKSAMYKVRAVLRTHEKDFLEHIDEHIAVLKSRVQPNETPSPHPLQTILKAIAEKKVLNIQYAGRIRQEPTSRCVEPVGLFYLDNFWHLIAFCRMRQDYRDFRIDRITHLATTAQVFDMEHPPLKDFLTRIYEHRDLHTVVIRLEKSVAHYLDEEKHYHGFISQTPTGSEMEMSFLTPSLDGFARWYLRFGDCAKIVQPDTLREKVRTIVSNIASSL